MGEPTFESPSQEIAYLKKALEDKQQELDEVENSFSEFQEFSKQLEEEMEQELAASEKKYAELLAQHKRLKDEHENLQEKLARQTKESSTLVSTLQEEVNKLTQSKNTLLKDVRRLEQENDTLERRERVLSVSVTDLQEKVEKAMEEDVWLQSELDEQKAQSEEAIQRLRDEIRDLKLELSIMERKSSVTASKLETTPLGKRDGDHIDYSPRPPKSPRRHALTNSASNAIGVSAMNMVTDMLSLVKDLEVRITTYRQNRSLFTPPASPRSGAKDSNSSSKEREERLKLSIKSLNKEKSDGISDDYDLYKQLDGANYREVKMEDTS
jgi:uncharacterized phage infection (PIP) family protein YhgE